MKQCNTNFCHCAPGDTCVPHTVCLKKTFTCVEANESSRADFRNVLIHAIDMETTTIEVLYRKLKKKYKYKKIQNLVGF